MFASAFINKNRENLTLDVSKHNRKLLSKYKVALITNTLLISILLYLNLFGQTPPSRYVSYLFFSSIYGTSGYLMFLSYEIANIQKIETAINELKTC